MSRLGTWKLQKIKKDAFDVSYWSSMSHQRLHSFMEGPFPPMTILSLWYIRLQLLKWTYHANFSRHVDVRTLRNFVLQSHFCFALFFKRNPTKTAFLQGKCVKSHMVRTYLTAYLRLWRTFLWQRELCHAQADCAILPWFWKERGRVLPLLFSSN